MNIFIFLIILIVLVLAHEFGHFFTAKKFGIRVDEFGFGFPPKIASFKKGETEYSINALPFGGFVKIFGENPDEESILGSDSSRSFVNKAKWKQAIVLVAGIVANLLLAWLLFSFGFMSGLPTSVSSTPKGYELKDVNLVVVSVLSKSPAEIAGLKTGDKIVSVLSFDYDLTEVTPSSLQDYIAKHEGKDIHIYAKRGEELKTIILKPEAGIVDGKPGIGIAMDQIGIAKLPLFPALWEGMKLDYFVTKGTVVGLYTLIVDGIQGKGSFSSVTGPVGMVSIVGDAYKFGLAYLLSFAALISVNLAVINFIPFPALDGGRLLFLLIEKIKGSRINPKIANSVNMVGFAILIMLMLLVTFHDVVKLF